MLASNRNVNARPSVNDPSLASQIAEVTDDAFDQVVLVYVLREEAAHADFRDERR